MRAARTFLLLACALAVWIAAGAVASSAAQAGGTYVALGDSVAAPSDSYVSIFFQFLRTSEGGGLDTLRNRAVSGADSTTLRTNGQLATAIADIDLPSDTKVVTIDIGGNDRLLCGGVSPSWHLSTCPFGANFDATLADLQGALGRDPGAEALIAMAYYNPASGTGTTQEQDYDRGLLGTDLAIFCAPSEDPRLGLNDRISCIASSRAALVADVYPAFKLGGQALMSGDGIHPSSQGQAVIAAEFRKALPSLPSDTVPPETTITGGPSGPTSDPTPTFTFTSSQTSNFECSVDGAAFVACSSPHTTAALSDGAHSFEVKATDAAGNTDASPARRDFTADTRAPGVKLSGARTQRAGKTIKVMASATNENLRASASGKVRGRGWTSRYKLRGVKDRFIARGHKATLKLKLSEQAQRVIRRALRKHKKVSARLTITARDAAGNTTVKRRTIKLRR
jgi:lysophospholipase L1-like esterase